MRRWAALTPAQRRALAGMGAVVALLHVAGFALLAGLAGSGAGALTIGIGITAYTLGMRHAFDADHIAAIDNTTRKLMADGRRPLSVGFWFSLGHSTIVFALAVLVGIGVRALNGAVENRGSGLHRVTGTIGTLVSGSFLYLIAALNVAILLGILTLLRETRSGRYDERELERRLAGRGLMNRFFGRIARAVDGPRQMYPVGVLFGLGFDTASEVALLVIAGSAGAAGLPFYAILCLPLLFAAGMSLLDSVDGALMSFAYGWALSRPVRKLFYNLAVTGLSVLVAAVIGTVELGGLLAQRLGFSGSFWGWLENIDINSLGMMIAGMFLLTWAVAVGVWRFGRIEERWSARLGESRPTSRA